MRQYNLKPTVKKMSFGELSVLALGERGRGRYEAIIPMASNIREHDFVKVVKTKSGKNKIIKSDKPSDTWLSVIDCEYTYTRHTEGEAYVPTEMKENISILSKGTGAYGEAGRTGNWYAYLAEIKANTFVWVEPSGGSRKVDPYWLYFGVQSVVRIEEGEMDAFIEYADVDAPKEGLIPFSDIVRSSRMESP